MRLLERRDNGEIRLTEDLPNGRLPPYAILSHTWGKEEVLFEDVTDGTAKNKAGYTKVQFCGDQAGRDGLKYFWQDTCCIQKSNSTELQEAINMMFRWYSGAAKCYVYLADVSTLTSSTGNASSNWESAFRGSRWFTRGWTLQELIAPTSVEFFSREGTRLGDRKSLEQYIHRATGIPFGALRGSPLSEFRVSERMAWVEKRNTTREEDKAYSLFGLFDVQIPLLYGEGEARAFKRLREEIDRGSSPAWEEKEKEILRRLHTLPYQDRKDLNPDRVPGTCDWFVSHELFRAWQESKLSRILWVSADPGCGKSVLAKHLVDSVLPTTESRTVCYFFFKDGFDDQTSVTSALCCILHQLFKQKCKLLSDAILEQLDADREIFTKSFSGLWQTLIRVAKEDSAGEIVCILDAIDECKDQGWLQLAKALCNLYGTATDFNLKFLLTSRPYDEIRRGFHRLTLSNLPIIHLSGESDAELRKIEREIDIFIEARVRDIGAQLTLEEDEQGVLLRELVRVPNRTYLWVHLTLDSIKSAISVNRQEISKLASRLPKTVDEAYDGILSKSREPETAVKILHIVVAASRPLTAREMSFALVLRENHQPNDDGIDLGPEDRFCRDVRQICGLFVTIINSRIYLLHQTAREFLVQNSRMDLFPQGTPKALRWKHSLQPQESHFILAEICVWHLLLDKFKTNPLRDESPSHYADDHTFLDYSAKNWAAHFRELPAETKKDMTEQILRICDTRSQRFQTWFRIYWTTTNIDFPTNFTTLMATSYFGLEAAVERVRKKDGSDLDSLDDTHYRSALSWAAGNGFDGVIRLLIESTGSSFEILKRRLRRRGRVNSADKYGRTPLTYAVWSSNAIVVKLLLEVGAKVDLKDEIGGTPLSYAVCKGHEGIVKLLFSKKTQIDSVDNIVKELLFSAAIKGDEAVVELLLGTSRVDIRMTDKFGQTPLSHAAKGGHGTVVEMLLATGKIDTEAKGLLFSATQKRDEATIKSLLKTGKLNTEAKELLFSAAKEGDEATVKSLLRTSEFNTEAKELLFSAAKEGDEVTVKSLLR
ncbi:hypothetical protein B0H67DRAFT_508993, partial [Lasiosphaeris hirsuta]